MFKLDYNPVSKYWHERISHLTKEQQELREAPLGRKENLIKLKKSKETVKEGDVFVLSMKGGLYFYGKVLQAKIEHVQKNSSYNEGIVIFIFKCKTNKKTLENFKPDYNKLLIGPDIVTSGYWAQGYFETIGNIPLTDEEKKLDYGFFRIEGKGGIILKANGEDMDHMPKYLQSYGISVYAGIYMSLRTEAIIDPTLLE